MPKREREGGGEGEGREESLYQLVKDAGVEGLFESSAVP